jgi:hypothetical protein
MTKKRQGARTARLLPRDHRLTDRSGFTDASQPSPRKNLTSTAQSIYRSGGQPPRVRKELGDGPQPSNGSHGRRSGGASPATPLLSQLTCPPCDRVAAVV